MMMGLVCTKTALVPTPVFHTQDVHSASTRHSRHVHANPVSLINARPRNERLIFFFVYAAQHSTPYAHHRPSSIARVQDHGPERPSMVQCRGRDRHIPHPKRTPRPAMLCRPRQLQFYLSVMRSWADMHSTRKAVRNWFTARGGPFPLRRAVRIRTRALQAQIIWIRLWARMSFRFWKEWGPTDHRSGPGVGQPKLQAPAGQGGIVPAHGELSRDSPPRRDGLFLRRGAREKSAGHPVAPSSQSGRPGQACGQFVTCREARGTGQQVGNPVANRSV